MLALKEDFRVAAVQTVSSTSLEQNLKQAGSLIAEAAADGAQLIALPEYFCLMGRHDRDKVTLREVVGETYRDRCGLESPSRDFESECQSLGES